MKTLADKSSAENLISILQKLSGLEQEFRYTNNPKSLFEVSLLGLFKDDNDLKARVIDLENKFKTIK